MEQRSLDLVDEMEWEDCDKVEIISLEEAGLEESSDAFTDWRHCSICDVVDWFYDGDCNYET